MGGNNCKSFSAKVNISGKKSCSSSSATESSNGDYIEGVVCKEAEIKDNEMKVCDLGGEDGGKILLIKQEGELHAVGTKCTHYGAPLNTGALGKGRVRCPWHGACFNIKTGDIEDFPGLDSLPCYKVTVQNGEISVRAKRTDLKTNKRVKDMCPFNKDNHQTVVIVGGGPAGATCAETLRQEGFSGRIVMVSKEGFLPYDRPKISKAMDTEASKLFLRPQTFYDENNIETKLCTQAIGLDVENKVVKLHTNEELKYTTLFISTGSRPRSLKAPGSELKNIFLLRTLNDASKIDKELSKERHLVILGSSFIGMEAAAYAVSKCASVTVVGRDEVPFQPVFGTDIGARIKQEFEEKGVKFITGTDLVKFNAQDGKDSVEEVELSNGSTIPADVVILGIGAVFNTEWLKDTPIKMENNGSITANEFLKTNIDDIYVGGDIACAPVLAANGTSAPIGHYGLAHYHGKIAAQNISGRATPLKTVPFFWTMLFGKSYRYAGFGSATEFGIHGSLEELKFFAYHFRDGKVVAMSSVARDPIVADFANLLYEGRTLTEDEVKKDPYGWMRNKPKDLMPPSKSDVFGIQRRTIEFRTKVRDSEKIVKFGRLLRYLRYLRL